MNRIYTSTYSVLILMLVFVSMILTRDYSNLVFTGGFSPLNIFSDKNLFYFSLLLAIFAVYLACLFFDTSVLRFAGFLLFLIWVFIPYIYFDRITHHRHVWLYAAFFVSLLDASEKLNSAKNLRLIRLTQISILCPYFIAGLWKLRHAFSANSWTDFIQSPLNHIGYSIAQGSGPGLIVREILQFPVAVKIICFSFIFVILFQLSAIIPIFKLKNLKLWGLGFVLFHIINGLLLGIWYTETILALLFFLIITELFLEAEPNIKTATQTD